MSTGPLRVVDMYQEFARFIELPSRATFLAARSAWLQLNVLPLTPADLQSVEELLAAGEADCVIAQVHAWKARAAFSPRAHYFVAQAHEQLGEVEQAETERWVFRACLQGILATGDGSRRKPYIVSQIPDEYDVLKLLGLTCERQQLIERANKAFDVLSCNDGSQLWFNISDLVALPAQQPAVQPLLQVAPPQPASSNFTRTRRRTSGRPRACPR